VAEPDAQQAPDGLECRRIDVGDDRCGRLQNFAYRVGLSWWMFALSGGMALAMAVLITGWQAVKAAWKSPVRALRSQ
jgi:hypothetical protein